MMLACLFDIAAAVALLSILLMLARRPFFARRGLAAPTSEAFIAPVLLVLLLCAFFGIHASEIVLQSENAAAVMPLSAAFAALLHHSQAAQWLPVCWWSYAIVLLLLLNYLPYSKQMLIITAIPNCLLRRLGKANTLPAEEFVRGNTFGVGQLDHFTWKDLLDCYACTECGRCREVCPASQTGKPLDPHQVIQQMKVNLMLNGAQMKSGIGPSLPLIGDAQQGSISEAAIWACTGCGACVDACPTFIEQMPKILLMRRHLVEMEAKFPAELLELFERMRAERQSVGPALRRRAPNWCAERLAPPAGADTEYLFFVGCAGAFDERGKQVTLAIAQLLDAAGLSWGVLGEEEPCCGDSLRRLGNEYLFARMATENVRLLHAHGVKKIIARCPHCYSTLKNDYRQFGADFEVIHHTELIQQLLAQGKLPMAPQTDPGKPDFGKVVVHDSCYLGRHNDIYQPPRAALAAATGQLPAELPRNRENAYCCGAGGGQMWLEENQGTRINQSRIQEALQTSPNTICVSCPYCLTSFEEGLNVAGAEESVRVMDVAEVVVATLHTEASYHLLNLLT